MVTPLSVAVKIWAKTNAAAIIILTICTLFDGELWGLLFVVLAVIFGYLLSSPLLIVITPMIKWSSRIPYANQSRMAWLIFFLFILYWLIFTGLRQMVGSKFYGFMSKQEAVFMLSIIVVQLLTVISTRKSLYKLYEQL